MNHQAEMNLYRQNPDLWAISRVLVHSKKYRKAVWDMLDDDERQILLNAKNHQTQVNLQHK